MDFLITSIFVFTVGLVISSTALQVYGTVLSFKKKWYIGLTSLVVPMFAISVAVAKLFLKKDILG